MSRKGYNPESAARRATVGQVGGGAAPLAPAEFSAQEVAGRGRPKTSSHEYILVSVWSIVPAPWQPRIVFNDIEALADSIHGDEHTQGVGIVEPLLVRPMSGGRYELIDGERRWRAAKIIANQSPDGDYLVPVRVFEVSNRVAQLIGQAANNERDEPKPLETALCYRRLREAMEQESGGKPASVRSLEGIGWHRRSMVNVYLTIADALTPEVLRTAGVLDDSGSVPEAIVTKLSASDLLAAAKAPDIEERAALLRAKVDRIRGIAGTRAKAPEAKPDPVTFRERLEQLRSGEGINVRVRGPLRSVEPTLAMRVARDEISPALAALVDVGARDTGGYLADIAETHTVLVVPREVEQLSAAQLERLAEDVGILAKRVRRASRFRRAGRVSAEEVNKN